MTRSFSLALSLLCLALGACPAAESSPPVQIRYEAPSIEVTAPRPQKACAFEASRVLACKDR